MNQHRSDIRFELVDRSGCCALEGDVARVDFGDVGRFVIHLEDVVGIELEGNAVLVRVAAGRIVEFGGVRWDGRYPPVVCATTGDAETLAGELRSRSRLLRARTKDRLTKIPNPFAGADRRREEAN